MAHNEDLLNVSKKMKECKHQSRGRGEEDNQGDCDTSKRGKKIKHTIMEQTTGTKGEDHTRSYNIEDETATCKMEDRGSIGNTEKSGNVKKRKRKRNSRGEENECLENLQSVKLSGQSKRDKLSLKPNEIQDVSQQKINRQGQRTEEEESLDQDGGPELAEPIEIPSPQSECDTSTLQHNEDLINIRKKKKKHKHKVRVLEEGDYRENQADFETARRSKHNMKMEQIPGMEEDNYTGRDNMEDERGSVDRENMGDTSTLDHKKKKKNYTRNVHDYQENQGDRDTPRKSKTMETEGDGHMGSSNMEIESAALEMEDRGSMGDTYQEEPQTSKKKKKKKDESEDQLDRNNDRMDTSLEGSREIAHPRKRTSTSVKYSDLSTKDFNLLQEYFPHLNLSNKSTVKTLAYQDLARIKDAKRKGIPFNFGRFTDKEDEQLETNVREFLFLSKLPSAEMLFHTSKYPEEKKTIQETKKKFNFREKIGEGIYRPTQSIYLRGVKKYLSGPKGRFSKEEVKTLNRYMKIHGNKWTKISSLMERSNVQLQSKAEQIRRKSTSGFWSTEEINRLIGAVKKFVKKSKNKRTETVAVSDLQRNIPWAQVENKVQTRNRLQCKSKWLHEQRPEEKGHIKWKDMAEFIGNVPMSTLQVQFGKLTLKYISTHGKERLREILRQLYEDCLPNLERKLEKKKLSNLVLEKRNSFTWDEIFQKCVNEKLEESQATEEKT
ncbi:hypothetical protein GDO86_014908 [Hymenochirus boettgeri]|uniref:Transcription termination factor 1 n=1 Tax=Hymenochirus boettgeri TaxID=247094 RepID=A0A8T2JQS2_9PIPI|nr:hypothetical protein GDO86_014908 [Hymenochirus boettgeri]